MKGWHLWPLLLLALSCAAQAEMGISVIGAERFGDDPTLDKDGSGPGSAQTIDIDDAVSSALTLQYFNTSSTSYDFWVLRLETDVSGDTTEVSLVQESLHFGGRKYWQDDAFRPYVGATVGIQRLDLGSANHDQETLWGFTLFAGLALPLTEHVRLIGEARMVGTVFSSDTALGCGTEGCVWHVQSQVWSQYDVGLGLSMQF